MLYALLSTIYATTLYAQVQNDKISLRTHLVTDAVPLHSTTDRATVEWACINKKLTEKCLIYHNDQWFSFTAPSTQKLFLNVSSQVCRNKYGVQVLVIEGNPCERDTYKLLHCESFTNQNDTFITLENLQAGQTYLVNIDGFLGDICAFDIQLSTKPQGLPLRTISLDTLSLKNTIEKSIVELRWKIPPTIQNSVSIMEVVRQGTKEFKSNTLAEIAVQLNTLGKPLDEYMWMDTLSSPDTYTYMIVGVSPNKDERTILDQTKVFFKSSSDPTLNEKNKRFVAMIPVEAKKKTDVDILVINDFTGEVLFTRTCLSCLSQTVGIDVTKSINQGIFRIRFEVLNKREKRLSNFVFVLNEQGEFIMK